VSAPNRTAWLAALARALDARLLLLWTAGVALPASLSTVPMWLVLGRLLDHSPRAHAFAERFDMLAFEDIVAGFAREGAALAGAGALSCALALAISPLLAGMTIAASRSDRRLTFAELFSGGIAWYARMFRMLLVSLLPLGLVAGLGALAFEGARRYGTQALRQSHANAALRAAWALTLIAFVLAHATLEVGRASMGTTDDRRSALRAWFHGVRLTFQRPLAILSLYLGPSLIGLVTAAVFLVLRLHVSASSIGGLAFGLVLTQLAAAAIGWGRASRLFALMGVSSMRE
jgi:hypothetical protein